MSLLAIWIGKFAQLVLTHLFGRNGGTWPGELTLRVFPPILSYFASQPVQIILIAGTNGKTTTAKMVETILSHAGKPVVRNESGANLDNGLVSTFVKNASITGKLRATYFIFEVDEATLPVILRSVTPHMLVLLNLFRDQLDRYGEVDVIAEKWLHALLTTREATTIINADDPHLAFIGSKLKNTVTYFGLADPTVYRATHEHATDAIYCPSCGTKLVFDGIYFSHLGEWHCTRCGFSHPKGDSSLNDIPSPLEGVYNRYNTLAAATVGNALGIKKESIREALSTFAPAFGRMEIIKYKEKTVKVLLSKNPTGFNESLRTAIAAGGQQFLFVLNDQIPDGRDVSWIWDVDFEIVDKKMRVFVSGDRALDLAVRLKYAGAKATVVPDLHNAVEVVVSDGNKDEVAWILPTYSAMLNVRQILTGKKIL